MSPFPSALDDSIAGLLAEGDRLADEDRHDDALARYMEAWSLIPEPKNECEASRQVLAAIGDAHYRTGAFAPATEAFNAALLCPGGLGDGFLYLRLGQCEFELGDLELAAEHLTQALEVEGEDIFDGEDLKYLEFLRKRTKSLLPEKW